MKRSFTYKVWNVDGSHFEHTFDKKVDLKTLQGWVGGLIEPVMLAPSRHGYVNEEGWLLGLHVNASFPRFVGPVVELPGRCRV